MNGEAPSRTLVFIETSSIRMSGSVVRYWQQEILETADTGGENRITSYREADCNDYSERSLQRAYFKDKIILQSDTIPSKLKYRMPGTVRVSIN